METLVFIQYMNFKIQICDSHIFLQKHIASFLADVLIYCHKLLLLYHTDEVGVLERL